MFDLASFLQAVINGLLIGGIYGLVSIGVTLIFVPLMFVFGMLVQQFLFRRVIGGSDLPQIFLTFALSLLLTNVAQLLIKGDVRTVQTAYGDASFNIANLVYI